MPGSKSFFPRVPPQPPSTSPPDSSRTSRSIALFVHDRGRAGRVAFRPPEALGTGTVVRLSDGITLADEDPTMRSRGG